MFARLVVALAAVAPLASSTDEAGKAWLAEKATEAGVISLPSGLMYKLLRPLEPDAVAPNQVIAGWTEAMQLMVKGDKWEMYIPSELGYGDRGSPPKIPGGAPLVFTMEILEINGATTPAARCDPATKKGCDARELEYVAKQAARTRPRAPRSSRASRA
ncbi:FK506 binding protein [Aureococcus anophagefferens]|nr:FK506 binding protein [Aureococcus anophagefferens]